MNINPFYLKYSRMLIVLDNQNYDFLTSFLNSRGIVTDLRNKENHIVEFNIKKVKNSFTEFVLVHDVHREYLSNFDICLQINNGIILPLNIFLESDNIEKSLEKNLSWNKNITKMNELILSADIDQVLPLKMRGDDDVFRNKHNERIYYKIKNKKSVGLFLYYSKLLDIKIDFNIFLEYLDKIESLEFRSQDVGDRFLFLYSKKIKSFLSNFNERKIVNLLIESLTKNPIKFQYLVDISSMYSIIEQESLNPNTYKFMLKKIRKLSSIDDIHEYVKNIFLMITNVNRHNNNFAKKQLKYSFLNAPNVFIPTTLKDLKDCAILMQNCSFSYYDKVIKESGCILYTKGKNNKLISCWYIQPEDKKNYSFYGKGIANSELPDHIYDQVVEFLSRKIFESLV